MPTATQQWLGNDTNTNHSNVQRATLRIVEKATVRSGPGVSSKKRVPSMQVGDIVQVYEQRQVDGHQRVRIGQSRWISRVTASGTVLTEPVPPK